MSDIKEFICRKTGHNDFEEKTMNIISSCNITTYNVYLFMVLNL